MEAAISGVHHVASRRDTGAEREDIRAIDEARRRAAIDRYAGQKAIIADDARDIENVTRGRPNGRA